MGRTWTEQERAYIAAHYGEMPAKVLATRLGRTVAAVHGYTTRYGLSYQRWTDDEQQYLREHYREGDTITSIHLGRTVSAIRWKRTRLGLSFFHAVRRTWTQSDDDYIRTHYPDEPAADIARALGRTKAAVARRAGRLSVRKSSAYMDRLSERQQEEAKTRVNPAKVSATLRRTYHLERARVMHGLPQKTRLRVSFETPQKRGYIARMRHRGYILSADRRTLYYTPTTDRSIKAEKSAVKHHIDIVEREGE